MLIYSLIIRAYNKCSPRKFSIADIGSSKLFKDYEMSTPYHLDTANVVADSLRRLSIAHIEEEKMEVAKDVHRLARLGPRLMDSIEGEIVVTNVAESLF